ncbi:lamin tail domain-containing protein [Algibacter sp. 2305UL17-15]|uniref:lamin tail domain-containing protein n=1 Tax=Algibacter sp. 2305UL17-15 TaxID=3231268 RepID=UPI003459F850
MKKKLITFIILLYIAFSFGQNLSANSTGSFIYTPASPLNSQTVAVFYHIPNGNMATMPILMSFHGTNRNANDYRDYWISMANTNGFMVFAPEFSDANYPTGDNYQLANIFDDGDNPSLATFNPENEWTISIIDPLFEYIKADISGTQEVYYAWGHSGGSQFLHRFVEYLPNSKLDIAVCSNAGWYTVPEASVDFPYGLNESQLPNATLTDAFAKKLYVHLGQNDTDPDSPNLRHNTVVDNQQGLNRLDRGRYFFTTSEATASSMSVPFNWEKKEVPGVGHNAQQMANDALQYIFDNMSSVLVINEVLYDPAGDLSGDANGDGTRDPFDDEFIEFINNSALPLDISGYTVSDDDEVRHIFPSGTIIPANGFLVLFGGGAPTGSFGGAIVQTASEGAGTLNLTNSGEVITVKNTGGTTVQTFDYGPFGSNINQSITRNPDITGSFVEHSTVVGGLLFSPGTLSDGTTLSTDELTKSELSIYPNPSNGIFYFNNSNLQSHAAEIYSVSGHLVSKIHFSKFHSKQEVNVSQLASGMYFFKINDKVVKFIKGKS